jgi:hypothetical protein
MSIVAAGAVHGETWQGFARRTIFSKASTITRAAASLSRQIP